MKKKREFAGYWIRTVLILSVALIMALPLYYIIVSTFKSQNEMLDHPFALPSHWSLENYLLVFQTLPVGRAFWNTIVVTVGGVFLQVFIGSLAAFGMILGRGRLVAAIGAILLVSFTIPIQATIIPLYTLSAKVGIINTRSGLVILYSGAAVFCYYLIVGYMRKLPVELFEAARLDGAGVWRIYYTIVLPLIRPILTTVVVFQTLAAWNDFMWPNIFLTSAPLRTVVLQVYNATGQFDTNWPLFMTITLVAIFPVFVFFIFTQRWIVSGLAAGSVKG